MTSGPGAPGELQADARAILEKGVEAVDPYRLVKKHLNADPLPAFEGRLRLLAVGKAAGAMAAAVLDHLAADPAFAGHDPDLKGVVLLPGGVDAPDAPGLQVIRGGHPVPTAGSVEGSRLALELAEGAGPDDLLLCLISGGGSALMTLPLPGVTLEELQETTRLLLRGGATIGELNTVRKHLDRVKGGSLALAAAPAQVRALVLSDVVGDPPHLIASGPVSPDPSTYADALRLLERRRLLSSIPGSVRTQLERGEAGEFPETPDAGNPCFQRVSWKLVGNNRTAVEGARAEAARRGYRTLLLTTGLTGEAREVGRVLAALGREARESGEPLCPPACLLAGGETTVQVTGEGRGGRNQEVALGAAFGLEGTEGVLVASMGTDGIDGPTDAAGALADGRTLSRAAALGLDAAAALDRNDAYPFFQALGDLLITGPTGTNVMDLAVVLVAPAQDTGRMSP